MEENQTILEIMGNNLKTARTLNGVTQNNLAEKIEVSDKFISMAERGISGLSVTSIVNICKILNIEPNALFNGTLDYNNNKDTIIKNKLTLLSDEDKDFVINVIEYIIKRGSK